MNELEKKAYIFGAVFVLSNKLQVLGDAFDKNITIKQWLFIVSILKLDESPTISQAAQFMGCSRQNAKRIASGLEKRGFVSIIKDNKDARAVRISLTEKCKTYFKGRDKKELEFINKLFNEFDAELTNYFYRSMKILEKNINIMEKENEEKEE